MRKYLSIVFLAFLALGCSQKQELSAIDILKKSAENSGYDRFINSKITFDIKDFHYTINRKHNDVVYTVERTKDSINYLATYNNGQAAYFINSEQQPAGTYELFTNFRLEGLVNTLSIPHIFFDYGVKARRVDDVEIRNIQYYSLYVTITNPDKEKPDDVFILYINKESFLVDYFADNYQLTNNKNLFRRLYNSRVVEGIRFYDHYVFISRVEDTPLEDLYKNFNIGAVLSTNNFQLENITVTPN